MRLFLALLGVALVAAYPAYPGYHGVDTRADCPPAGYTALSPHSRLDRLPSGGKYAICQTAANAGAMTSDFTLTSGVFRLRNSELIVDAGISIVFQYPARPDWSEVAVKQFPGVVAPWYGVTVRGAPSDDVLESHYQPHWPAPFGNCGNFDTVVIDGVDDANSLTLDHCSEPTSVNKLTIFATTAGRWGLFVSDSKHIVILHSTFNGRFNSLRRGGNTNAPVEVIASQIGFVNPVIYGDDEGGMRITDSSSVTVCDGFILEQGGDIFIVDDGAGDTPSTLTVAGISNANFPGDVYFSGGLVYLLQECPTVMRPTYDMSLWTAFYVEN